MILSDEEAFELKAWVVQKLEDISDADSDVLGDYVLALIRAETPEPELRLSAIANLEDFLQDSASPNKTLTARAEAEKFVDETFQALHSKSFRPGYVQPPIATSTTSLTPAVVAPTTSLAPKYSPDPSARRPPPASATDQSRKRSHNDHYHGPGYNDPHYAKGDRQIKQMRRGGLRGGRYDDFNGRSSHGPSESLPAPGQFPYPGMPPPPSDPNDPLMAMMLQAMGMPLPTAHSGVAGLPAKSPTTFSPPDHGSPTFNGVRNDEVRARCSDYDTRGFCVKGNTCPFEHGNDHMVAPGQEVMEYDPKNSAITDVLATSPISNGYAGHDMTLWNQDHGHSSSRGHGDGRDRGGRGRHALSRGPRRAEFSHAGPNFDRSNTTIVVESIPEDKFDEGSVRDFFSVFGTITEVDMRPYKHLAIIKYSDYRAAKSAYDSPKVIFDNRFVKVYWYKPGAIPTSTDHNNDLVPRATSNPGDKEPGFNREEFERNAMAAQKKLEEKKAMMKDAEEKRQALEKQKEELAQKQAEEKRRLLEKLATQRKSSNSAGADGSTNGLDKHANGTTDTEDKASAQTKALRAQVAALEAEAKSLGLDTALTEDPRAARGRGRGRARGRGRGSYRGWEGFAGRGPGHDTFKGSPRGRGGFVGGGAYNLDNRPKKVSVSGVEFNKDKDEALRQHLFAIGEFEAIEAHAEKPDTQIVTFKDRKTAERFMYGTKNIPSVGAVELAWINTPLPPVRPTEKGDVDEDTIMSSSNPSGEQPTTNAEAAEVDYDVAEEDDRWMAS
ncbi:MAG: hypothetical protein Q9216_003960 [Gyalolechia sp. 2 TL-2023]